MEIVGYHASRKKGFENVHDGTVIQIKTHKWVNDLGNGFYCYVDEKDAVNCNLGFDTPKRNAEKYCLSFPGVSQKNIELFKIKSQFKDGSVLNLSDPNILRQYSEFISDLDRVGQSQIINAGKINDGRAHRAVIDGFFIEKFIDFIENQTKENGNEIQKVSAVIMVTATDFDFKIKKNNNRKYRTHIPNGCELCIREKDCIKEVTKIGNEETDNENFFNS